MRLSTLPGSPALRAVAAGLLALVLALASALAIPAPVRADVLTPESGGSPNADAIHTLYTITLIVGAVVFVGVEVTLVVALRRFRHRRRGPEPPQVRGNTRLEVGWTVGAALVLVALTVVTFLFLGDITNPAPSLPGGLGSAEAQRVSSEQPPPRDGKRLEVDIVAQQYLFRYDYPGPERLFSYYEMVVPIKTTVIVNVTSSDVIHAWWVPKLGGKRDAVPGHTTRTWFRIDKPGLFRGQCAELCGENHAQMLTRVRAVPVAEYEAWVRRTRREIRQAQTALARTRQQSGERFGFGGAR